MTTREAVHVASIMIHHGRHPAKMIASFIYNLKVDWVDFFNELHPIVTTELHDEIFKCLEELRNVGNLPGGP